MPTTQRGRERERGREPCLEICPSPSITDCTCWVLEQTQTNEQIDWQTDRHSDSETDRHTDTETDRHTHR